MAPDCKYILEYSSYRLTCTLKHRRDALKISYTFSLSFPFSRVNLIVVIIIVSHVKLASLTFSPGERLIFSVSRYLHSVRKTGLVAIS